MHFDKLDIKLWKDIQDNFSNETGISLYTIDVEGNVIFASGEMPFLFELIKSKNPEMFKKVHYQQLNNVSGKDVGYCKMFGTVSFIKPLILYDKIIGAILCCPVNKEHFDYSNISANINIEKSEIEDAANDIKEIKNPEEHKRIVSLIAEILPKLTYQKKSRDDKIAELTSLHSIIRMVNSTLDLDKILKSMMNFLVDNLNAYDCSVSVYNEEGNKKYVLNKEVQKMSEIEKDISRKAIEENNPVFVKDLNSRFKLDLDKEYNTILSIPLKIRDEIIGAINIYGSHENMTEDKLSFISLMADQIAIAIANAQRFEQVKELAVVDKLTGVFNRRYFMELAEKEMDNEINIENSIALVLFDIDSFGKYNNAHGHPKGDELLKELSKIIKINIRDGDAIGRYGGEEFILMLPKTNPQTALSIAENIKNAVAEHAFYGCESQPNGKVTISAGLVVSRANVSLGELVREADNALYKAKNSGKNKVVQKIILSDNLRTEV